MNLPPMPHHATLRALILDEQRFVRAVFSGQQPRADAPLPWQKLVIRPVQLKRGLHWQFSYFDARQDITKNYVGDDLYAALDDALGLPFKHFHVITTTEDVQVRITKKGRALLSRGPSSQPQQAMLKLTHDRVKQTTFSDDPQSHAFLKALGIMAQDGRIKSAMQAKYRQINRFLELVAGSGGLDAFTSGQTVHVVDCGSGSGYLTFATYHHLTQVHGLNVLLTGVDLNAKLMNKQAQLAADMGWTDSMHFETAAIIDHQPALPVDMVVALHACDTATDESLAQGIRWGAKLIIAAPCCHHHLQVQMKQNPTPSPFDPVLREGILHERLGDILTDTFRALLLRRHGYRADVVQFISAEHTPKNLMIRAVKRADPNMMASAAAEYAALKAFWGATPYLETLLSTD